MIDHTTVKLGKKAAVHDPRTLRLANYLDLSLLPVLPASIDWSDGISNWGMMLNDSLGDCTCAAAGHLMMLWSANDGKMFTPADADILAAYEAVGGYKPSDASTDNGAIEVDVLNFWTNEGIAGDKIAAYAYINAKNQHLVMAAVDLFGGCYVGVALPVSAQNQHPWHITDGPDAEPGSWGGHAIPIVAYDEDGLTCITWGTKQKMTWDWFFKYCDEAYAILDSKWFGDDNTAPNHFNLAQLQSDLKALG